LACRFRAAKPCYRAAAALAAVCAAGVLGGCDVTIKDGDVKGISRARASQEWSRHYPLAQGGTVEIVNSGGPIQVLAGPAGAVDVAAVLEAEAFTDARVKEILSDAKVEETITPDRVRVAATTQPRRHGDLEVRFTVTMPVDARLEMTGNNGVFKADGLRSHVKAMVVNGSIELTALRGTVDAAGVNSSVSAKMAEVSGPVRLESTNGRVALEIPKTAQATLNARSLNGSITLTGLAVEEGTGRRIRTLESQLNGGGPEIDLRVTNGRISITGVDNPAVQGSQRAIPPVQSPQSR
jgi:hypothetical protein